MIKEKSFWWLYNRMTLAVILLVVIFSVIFFLFADATYGINKTVGWAWDLTNIFFWTTTLAILIVVFLMIAVVSFIVKLSSRYFKY